MKLFILLLVVLVCLEASSASRLGRVFGSAFAVHKKIKKAAANKKAQAAVKPKNIKQAPITKLKDDIDLGKQKATVDVVKVPVVEDPARAANILKRQASLLGRQQMVLSIGRMVLSRFVFKINYKDPKTLVYARLTFVGYLLLYQVCQNVSTITCHTTLLTHHIFLQALLWFLNQQVSKRDDNTILHKAPNSGMQALLSKVGALSGQSAMTNTLLSLAQLTTPAEDKMTVKAHDIKQIKELTSALYFELFTTSVMHFVFGFQVPVLMAPLMGVCKLLQHPLVLLHVFRMHPVGQLERPFKTGLETFMSSLSPAKPAASASVDVAGAGTSIPAATTDSVGVPVAAEVLHQEGSSDVSDETDEKDGGDGVVDEENDEEHINTGAVEGNNDGSTDEEEATESEPAATEEEGEEDTEVGAAVDTDSQEVAGDDSTDGEVEIEGDSNGEGEGESQQEMEQEQEEEVTEADDVSTEEAVGGDGDGDDDIDSEGGAAEGDSEGEDVSGEDTQATDGEAGLEEEDATVGKDEQAEERGDAAGEEEGEKEGEEEGEDQETQEEEEEEQEWWEKEEEEEEEGGEEEEVGGDDGDDELLDAIDHLGD